MRLIKLNLAALFIGMLSLASMNSACSKANAAEPTTPTTPTTNPTIYGIWEGTYTTDGVNHLPMGVSFAIFPDGTIVKRAKVVGSTEVQTTLGTWTMSGAVLSYSDVSIGYSGGTSQDNASFSVVNNVLISGTWRNIVGPSPGSTGKFQNLKKVE